METPTIWDRGVWEEERLTRTGPDLGEEALKERVQPIGPDYALLIAVAALVTIGLLMVYSSTFIMAYDEYGSAHYFVFRQLLWTAIGAIGLYIMNRIDYHWWQRFSILIMGGVAVLLMGLLLFARDKFGAQRWILNGSIQPSELCKLAAIMYIAAWLASKGERVRQVTYGLIPFAVLIGLIAGLIILQPDFSTAVLIVAIAVAMFFVAGADILQLVIGFIFGSAALVFLVSRAPYRLARIMDFLASLNDPASTGYHVKNSLIALGTGGIFGKGLGASRQKLGYLPASHTDSIFAVLGEELGLLGCILVIALFALLAARGFKIALEAPDTFGAVLATGVTCWIIFQAMLNVAVATSTVPFSGIPLPFISFGGSSLVTCLAGIGLLESIAIQAKLAARRKSARYGLRREDGWTRLSDSGRP